MDDFIVLHQPWSLSNMKRKMQIYAFKIITIISIFTITTLPVKQ